MKLNYVKIKKCWPEREETGTLIDCWWESKMVQVLCKTLWQFIKKLNINLPYELAILFLGVYPREMKICLYQDLYSKVHSSIIYNSQKLEITQISTNQ